MMMLLYRIKYWINKRRKLKKIKAADPWIYEEDNK